MTETKSGVNSTKGGFSEMIDFYDLDVMFEGAEPLPRTEEIVLPDYDEDGGFYDEVQGDA